MDWADKEAERIVEGYYETPGVTHQDLKGVIGVALRDAQNKAFEKCAKRAEQEAEGTRAMDDYPMTGSSRIALEIAHAIRAFAPQEGGYVPPESKGYNVSKSYPHPCPTRRGCGGGK